MTERLYWIDSHLREFDAAVRSCTPLPDGRWAIILDRTAFFPEGGGQPADTGTLGGVAVLHVRERNGEAEHLCAGPLPEGAAVHGMLDWEARFQRMQFHSGEHILSGTAHRLWGCSNVGFHMNPDLVTLDFDRELSSEQLAELEETVNRIIWENRPVRTFFPDREALSGMDYRSKKEIDGQVRLVEFPGADLCACCAPHVDHTGEIGLVRLTDSMRHRGGVRLTMLAGRAAWEDARKKSAAVESISRQLSVPRDTVAEAVARQSRELEQCRDTLLNAQFRRLRKLAESLPETEGNLCVFQEPGVDMNALRELVNEGVKKCGGMAAAFTGSDEEGWKYIIGSRSVDLRANAKAINAAIGGRGGGSSAMIQGSAAGKAADIRAFFEG